MDRTVSEGINRMLGGPRAHGDFETKSVCDLKKSGAHRYAEHPSTRVITFSWSLYGGMNRWRPGLPDPVPLLDHIARGGTFVGHNVTFEFLIWAMLRRTICPHWPELRIEQIDCTMARALAVGLPGKLEELGTVLGLKQQKDTEGHALMLRYCKPRKLHSNGFVEWWDNPVELERLYAYCDQDVYTEMEADPILPPLSDHERLVWELDQRINHRGIYIDEAIVAKAADVVVIAKREADKQMRRLTGGAVKKCTEVSKIVEWINSKGIECTSLKKGDHYELNLWSDWFGMEDVSEVIDLRKQSAKTSVAKYDKTLDCLCDDGRVRGLLQYHGAGPGRWAGRLTQPQNYPRVDPDVDGPTVEWAVEELSTAAPAEDVYWMMQFRTGKPLVTLSKTLRATMRAAPGHTFYGGDFSNIEGRINAWLAGEEWKLQAFRDYDTIIGEDKKGKPIRKGPDLYYVTAAMITGKPIEEVTKAERQAQGKVSELSLGYQGGVGAYVNMGDTYLVRAEDLVAPVKATAPEIQWATTLEQYDKATDKCGLPRQQWTAIKIIVKNWRAKNSKIMEGWWELQDAAIAAVDWPGVPQQVYGGRAAYLVQGNVLYCRLPSGRLMCYNAPYIRETKDIRVDKYGEEYEVLRRTVWFQGKDRKTGAWGLRSLYGGLQCENIVQATARCVMDRAMLRVEAAGFPLVLTVHDELLAEKFIDVAGSNYHGSVEYFAELMSQREDWYESLPLAVAAWTDERYVK